MFRICSTLCFDSVRLYILAQFDFIFRLRSKLCFESVRIFVSNQFDYRYCAIIDFWSHNSIWIDHSGGNINSKPRLGNEWLTELVELVLGVLSLPLLSPHFTLHGFRLSLQLGHVLPQLPHLLLLCADLQGKKWCELKDYVAAQYQTNNFQQNLKRFCQVVRFE